MTLTRAALTREYQALAIGSRGRAALARLLRRMTLAELSASTGIKPRVRVKAGRADRRMT